jgi:LacI family transcriptional regulator
LILAPRQYSYSVAVRQSYADWIANTGGESLIAEVDGAPVETAGYTAGMELLKADAPPDAIYAALDRLAVGALFAAEHCGLKVPQDLLLGAGSDGVTRNATVPITALNLQPHKLGQIAVSLLIDRIEQGIEPRQVTVPGKIEVRASTTPV